MYALMTCGEIKKKKIVLNKYYKILSIYKFKTINL